MDFFRNIGLKDKFYDACKNRPSSEVNFILSHKNTMAAFVSGKDLYTGIFAILDDNFNILYRYDTTAYINSCGISDNGKYAIFNTANSDTQDGGKAFFIDIESHLLIFKRPLQENWKDIRGYFINELSKEIIVTHDDYKVCYNFDGSIKNNEEFFEQKLYNNAVGPYELNEEANSNILYMLEDGIDERLLNDTISLLETSEQNKKMSSYQLSLTYKNLGDLYLKNNKIYESLYAYEKGFALNSKLSVKRKIAQLQKLLMN